MENSLGFVPSIASQSIPKTALWLIMQAKSCLKQGKLDSAIAACKCALAIDPTVAARRLLGTAFQLSNQPDDAMHWYRPALQLQPPLAEAQANLGSLHAQQQFTAVEENENSSGNGNGNGDRASLSVEGRLVPAAQSPVHSSDSTSDHPTSAADAIAECEHLLAQLAPQTAADYKRTGNALRAAGRREEVADYYRKAIAILPDLAEAHANLGSLHAQQQRWNEVIACYDQALTHQPTHWDLHHYRGDALLGLQRWDEAIAAYDRAIEYSPAPFLWSYYNQAEALLERERYDEALQRCEQVMALDPRFFAGHHRRGQVLLKLRRWQDAITATRIAISLQPDFAWSHRNLGCALLELGQWEAAATAFQRANQLNPDLYGSAAHPDGLTLSAHDDEVIAACEQALQAELNKADLHQAMGDPPLQQKVEALQQQIQQLQTAAIEHYRWALELNPIELP